MESTTISCDDCTMRATSACDDCVVSFLCQSDATGTGTGTGTGAVVIDVGEARALRLLSRAGLVPELRHRRATG